MSAYLADPAHQSLKELQIEMGDLDGKKVETSLLPILVSNTSIRNLTLFSLKLSCDETC